MGHHNIRFDGDPHALSGAWSPPTSRANFCEEDYALTYYLAEFINSLTNIAYVYLAMKYMYGPGSRGIFRPKLDFMSISLLGLGICSFLFHASMRSTLEFADELSMMGLNWSLLQSVLTVRQSPAKARVITVGLAVIFISFTVYYLQHPLIIYQVIAFLSGIGGVILRTNYLLRWLKPAFPDAKCRDWEVRGWTAVGISVLGYAIWNVDLECCNWLRAMRDQVGLPWAWLFEFHGWWHILTAIGANMFMDVAREIQAEVEAEKKKE